MQGKGKSRALYKQENSFGDPFGSLRENYTKNPFLNNVVIFLVILNENERMKLKYLKTKLQ